MIRILPSPSKSAWEVTIMGIHLKSTHPMTLAALVEFKPDFYYLLLIDINLPYMNGFELYKKISKIDINVKVCFMSAGEVNHEAIREIHPALNIGSFIQKPITIDYLIKRLIAELE